jgi:hypothetical protein
MKTKTFNIKKIIAMFVLLLVCSSVFMLVGCSNTGESITWTNSTAVATFNYNTGWEDPRCTEYSKGQESLESAYETFFKSINLSYTAKQGATAETGTLFDFRKKGASISNLTIKSATEGTSTRIMRVTYNGVSCEVKYKVSVTQGTAKS